MDIQAVILAGGIGSRLWPLSRELFPKQFLSFDNEATMLQLTIKRTKGIANEKPLVICNKEHRFIVAEQLRQVDLLNSDILLEPCGRNTAPAIALAALHLLKDNEDTLILVLAADHIIKNVTNFKKAVEHGVQYATAGKLVTFGVCPVTVETGYGYIHKGRNIGEKAFCIAEFVEKPDFITAEKYLETGEYLWNSGMFLFSAKKYLSVLGEFNPEMLKICEAASNGSERDNAFIHISECYTNTPADSIDYAIMEKTNDAVVIEMVNIEWSDIGSWASLWEINDKDEQGNYINGDIITFKSANNYIQSESALVAAINVDNLVIVQTKDAVLVADKDKIQNVKFIVAQLKAKNRDEYRLHREVYRPWGKYDSLDFGNRYKVKCITVKPGGKLSLQKHYHRSEHWVVVQGTAKVTKEDVVIHIYENQSMYIPIGVIHSLENPGKLPLILIEIQSGAYLDEDDIVRFNDKYGR